MYPLESEIKRIGRELADAFPSDARHPVKVLDDKAMEFAAQDAELRAALFRFVDVVPACRSPRELADHLTAFLEEVDDRPQPLDAAMRMADSRAGARALGIACDAAVRLRALMRLARDLEAHLHIDMESLDSCEAMLGLMLELLSEQEFDEGPSAGVVVQAYLRDSPQTLEGILDWTRAHRRVQPLVVRLVKGAYWDHEIVEARRHGWPTPVFEDKAECDRNFEALTTRLLESRPLVRVAVASHNLRSVAHAIAANRAMGAEDRDLELQVLRGLGDDLQHALAAQGFRVRTYCPVGDLVAGMAYLVRRLLENTSNESFLHEQAKGVPLERLLAAR